MLRLLRHAALQAPLERREQRLREWKDTLSSQSRSQRKLQPPGHTHTSATQARASGRMYCSARSVSAGFPYMTFRTKPIPCSHTDWSASSVSASRSEACNWNEVTQSEFEAAGEACVGSEQVLCFRFRQGGEEGAMSGSRNRFPGVQCCNRLSCSRLDFPEQQRLHLRPGLETQVLESPHLRG